MASSSNLDSLLSKSANDLAKEQEVQRVMKAFKLNPYDILDLPAFATEAEVKKQYRKKSLLIHPDKFKHENGLEAFDFLKKAEAQLSDSSKRTEIDAIMTHCRTAVLKSVLGSGYSTNIADTDPRITSLRPPLDAQIRAKAKEVFVEDELAKRRKSKLAFANEGAEKAKAEAEVAARKRKIEEQAKWEDIRFPLDQFVRLQPLTLCLSSSFLTTQNDATSASAPGETLAARRLKSPKRTFTFWADERLA